MKFAKIKDTEGFVHYINISNIVSIRHLPKQSLYIIYLIDDKSIDIPDTHPLWWLEYEDAVY